MSQAWLKLTPSVCNILLFVFAASSTVVPCITTVMSSYGSSEQKGTVMGIFRSLGALARAFGPLFSSTGRSWDRKNRPAKSPDKVGQWRIFFSFSFVCLVFCCGPGGLCPSFSYFQISYYQIGWPVVFFVCFFLNILQCKYLLSVYWMSEATLYYIFAAICS